MSKKHNIKPFKKILVANRSEIAIRILRAISELNIRTVAIYTYEDRYSLHRYKADESYKIGRNDEPLKPYLDIERIINLAKSVGVDAIHPGYGFLSENVEFARRCREEGIVFIGPSPETMEKLGDKVAAKKLAKAAKVPLIEGGKNAAKTAKAGLAEAKKIGFPVVVKAAAGGGGRGMRVVLKEKDFVGLFHEASSEAEKSFNDGTVFIEKFIQEPKHIEVQLLGDHYGNLVHLYERDCSVQRRFQKVVEIAPCITISQETKDKLYDYAIRLGKEADYYCAGTVEFLVDKDENIYFIEVNPRIQVEHTITEEITDIDIVRSQILISMGHPLSAPGIYIDNQESIQLNGCSIQCRITTEDPENDFTPDYGTLTAYRSAAGFGIRLDAGSAYAGATISPFFDSMLVKVTGQGRSMEGVANKLHRALREFRIRGVKTNIGFLLNLLKHPEFVSGKATVNFITDHPELFNIPKRQDRGTKMLKYIGNVIVNGNPDVKFVDPTRTFRPATARSYDGIPDFPKGSKQLLTELGPEKFAQKIKKTRAIQYTDTTFRDAHQSLLATRMRTLDLMRVAKSFAKHHGGDLFSMEVWGGATFDVAMRFLKEDPWERLRLLREAIPNTLLQMLLRGSNAVGYTAYPDNLVEKFVVEAAKTGIDVFRIFDSLNWLKAMETSIKTVRKETDSLAEVSICYTGDITNPERTKFNLQYYLDLARSIEDAGAHILAIKDMAGLLKPKAATLLIKELKKVIDIPIHLHTHDTAGIQSGTLLAAVDAGVDIIDVALASMSGLTSQPNFNSIAASLQGHRRENKIDVDSLNKFSNYWEAVREVYYPFETELRAGTAEVYNHEIPGGQYSNLRPQARGLGLEDQFETIKKNYVSANELFGDIIKVTPSSKVAGDMAMFMTSNGLCKEDVLQQGHTLDFPDSVKALMRGDLGQIKGGFPKAFQKMVLKGEKPYTYKPNKNLKAVDFKNDFQAFKKKFGAKMEITDFLSYVLYPRVFKDYQEHLQEYGKVQWLPTTTYFFGLKVGEEVLAELEPGKRVLIEFRHQSQPNDKGERLLTFKLNGQTRAIRIKDNNALSTEVIHQKSAAPNEVGAPLQGSISEILVKKGDKVKINDPLFVIEAMKMETTVTAPVAGVVKRIVLKAKTMVGQDDLVIELG